MAGGILTKIGDPIQLNLVLEDGNTSKFPQAVLRDSDGVLLGASPVDLVHVGEGHYEDESVAMPTTQEVHATYIVYDDAGHTLESITHLRADDIYARNINNELLESISTSINSLVMGSLPGQELAGFLEDKGALVGLINDEGAILEGIIEDSSELVGQIFTEDDALVGLIDDPGDALLGVIEC